jgi:type I pantothenate kinase
MKLKLPTSCRDTDKKFINKFSDFILYQYNEYIDELKLFTKKKAPFLVGFNGSVASGKSYMADSCYTRLKECGFSVVILSTDNFIYPNRELLKKRLMHRKGFPESYNISKLMTVLEKLKKGKAVSIPVYDQAISDISDKKHKIKANTDIIIIEGINILDPYPHPNDALISDYLNYSIYIDAPEEYIKKWFYERLKRKKTQWKKQGIRKKLTRKNGRQFRKWAMDIWKNVNKLNLDEYILPFKERANLIIYKNKDHKIKEIAVRI